MCVGSCHIYIHKGRVWDFEIVILSLEAKPMKKNSTMAKPIPASLACESHNYSRKQSYTAEALSESEMNAVMQLIQLSSADSYSDNYYTYHHQEDDTNSNNSFFSFSLSKVDDSGKSIDAAASSSYSSSSLPPVATVLLMEAAEDEDRDGDEFNRSNLGERRNERCRSIVEIYRVTDKSNNRKKKKQQQRAN